jgi:hypothetical protein
MCIHSRALAGLSLIGLAVMAAACSNTEHLRQTEHAREVAELRLQIDQRDQLVEALKVELKGPRQNRKRASPADSPMLTPQMLVRGLSGTPALAGRVTNVFGQTCTITVDANPGNIDIQKAIDERTYQRSTYADDGHSRKSVCLLRFAIYGDDGHKADVQAVRFDAEAGGVLCEVVPSESDVKIVVGDKADIKSRRPGPRGHQSGR